MILQRLKQRHVLASLAKTFLIYFILYGVIMYLLREKGEVYFSLPNFLKTANFALLMSFMFAMITGPRGAVDKGEQAQMISFRPYWLFFIETMLFMLVGFLLFFAIGWLLFNANAPVEEPAKELLKLVSMAIAFAALLTGLAWFVSRKPQKTA
jgi:hypothetical protein